MIKHLFSTFKQNWQNDTKAQKKWKNSYILNIYMRTVARDFILIFSKPSLLLICQHGFMKNRSMVMDLMEYAYFVLNSIEEEWQVNYTYTDFSKGFDRVRHQLLLWVSRVLDAYDGLFYIDGSLFEGRAGFGVFFWRNLISRHLWLLERLPLS
jgi:hypothetical protein